MTTMMTMIIFDPLGSLNEEDSGEQILFPEEIQPPTEIDKIESENEDIMLERLYSATFDMQATIATIRGMPKQMKRVMKEIDKNNGSLTCGDIETFELMCMDVIEKIVKINRNWARQDAIQEAAKELVAVRKAAQSKMAEMVHMRVLREFQIATDEEYHLLWKQIWDE